MADSASALDVPVDVLNPLQVAGRSGGKAFRHAALPRLPFPLHARAITWRTSALSTTSRMIAASANAIWLIRSLRLLGAGLLPHEYVHSWNGKFRRPADYSCHALLSETHAG